MSAILAVPPDHSIHSAHRTAQVGAILRSRQLRKATKGKSIFPNDEALTKMLYLATMEVTRKWTMRVANWGQIVGQLAIYFEDRLAPYLTR